VFNSDALLLFMELFFAGLSTGLVYSIFLLHKLYRKTDAERMLWCNKALIREGQAKIFSDEAITTGDTTPIVPKPSPAKTVVSQFRKGLNDLTEKVRANRRVQIPDEAQEAVRRAAEEYKEKQEQTA
jgi:hypothetical protein